MNKKVPRKSHMRKTSSGKVVPVREHTMTIPASRRLDFPDEDDFSLRVRSVVYVPTTKDKNKRISEKEIDERVEQVTKFMDKVFGGSTAIKGRGTFLSETGEIIGEDVIKIESFTNLDDYKKFDEDVEDFLEQKKLEWGQESMGYEFENEDGKTKLVFV